MAKLLHRVALTKNVMCELIEAYKSFNKFFKFFDAASVMKALVCSRKLAALTIFPLTMVAAAASCSYVSTMRLAICFRSLNAKNMSLCVKVCPSIGKAWNQTRPFSINRVPYCWIIMKGDFHILFLFSVASDTSHSTWDSCKCLKSATILNYGKTSSYLEYSSFEYGCYLLFTDAFDVSPSLSDLSSTQR